MRDSDNDPMILMLAIDYLIGKVSHQVKVMAFIAPWKSCRIRSDLLQRQIEIRVEALGGLNATFSVPRQRLGVLAFGGGANDKVNHRGRPCAGRVDELPTMAKRSFDRRHKLRFAVATRQSTGR